RNSSEAQQATPQPPAPTPAPEIPGPLGQKVVPVNGANANGAPEPARPGKPQLTRIPAPPPSDTSLQQAMTVATRGLHLSDQRPGDDSRSTLARRLSVAGLLLRHGASEAEVIAGLILEPAESGALSADDVGLRFGPRVERVLEECASL